MDGVWFRRCTLAVTLIALAAGVGLRVQAFARNPSFWVDEARLALNVVHKPPAELLRPLDLNQGAPPGYLLLSRQLFKAFGDSEFTFRAASLVAGLAALFGFAGLARAALPEFDARLATTLFALSPYLVAYSAEFKQYELDAAIAVGLLALARPLWLGTGGVGRGVALAVAGAVAVWFSHPAAFVLAGVGVALGAEALRSGDRRAIAGRVLIGLAWAGSFVACWGLVTRHLGCNPYLLGYWSGAFAPLPPKSLGDVAWVAHHLLALFDNPCGFDAGEFNAGGLAALCWLLGAVTLGREERPLLVAVTLPVALVFLASGLRLYPFAGRLMLFAVPMLLLPLARGAALAAARLGGGSPWVAPALAGMLLLPGAAACWRNAKTPPHGEAVREVVAELRTLHAPGQPVYVLDGAAPGFAYYAAGAGIPAADVALGTDCRGDPSRLRGELRPVTAAPVGWVVVAHTRDAEEAAVRAFLDAHGETCVVARFGGARLVRVTAPPATDARVAGRGG